MSHLLSQRPLVVFIAKPSQQTFPVTLKGYSKIDQLKKKSFKKS